MISATIGFIQKRIFQRQSPRQEAHEFIEEKQRADAFFAELSTRTNPAGNITRAFCDESQRIVGCVQLHRSNAAVILHRIWTLQPGNGHGSTMLRTLCELADRHQIQLRLKVAPLGAKPYPMSADQLRAWYSRHGFQGTKKMIRQPVCRSFAECL